MDTIQLAAPGLKASICKHSGIREVKGKGDLDKSHAVCKLCQTKLKYFGNTTNMRNYISHFQLELEEKQTAVRCFQPVFTCSHCVYLQHEVRVEEGENTEHNAMREEDTRHPKTTDEEQQQSPSAPKRRASSSVSQSPGADLH